ncbi:TPA: hypothetical protein ACFOQ4_002153, partial [Neisseria meningitidis]
MQVRGNDGMQVRGNDGMQVRGNDEVEVTRNLKQAKPNELDSHFRGNDGRAASVAPDKCRNLKSRHSRAGGNLDIQC